MDVVFSAAELVGALGFELSLCSCRLFPLAPSESGSARPELRVRLVTPSLHSVCSLYLNCLAMS